MKIKTISKYLDFVSQAVLPKNKSPLERIHEWKHTCWKFIFSRHFKGPWIFNSFLEGVMSALCWSHLSHRVSPRSGCTPAKQRSVVCQVPAASGRSYQLGWCFLRSSIVLLPPPPKEAKAAFQEKRLKKKDQCQKCFFPSPAIFRYTL